ncbi:AMIN domain-containing protein [Myxococcota bacterium]
MTDGCGAITIVAMPGDDEKKKEAVTKRAHKRVDFFNPVKVVVPDDNTAVDVFAGNVSKGGMFLRSNRPLPKGKKVTLEFETQEGKVKVEEGEVVWNKEFEPISIDGSPAGMGVEFRSMSDDSQLKIEAFIDDALQSKPQPEEAPAPPPEPAPAVEQPQPEPPPPAESAPSVEPMRMKLNVAPAAASAGTKPDLAPAAASAAPEQEEPAAAEPREKPGLQQPPKPPVEGGEAIMATAPPRRRTKMMLFGGFVILVALVTFLTLLLIKPPGDNAEPETAKPPAPEKPAPAEVPGEPKKPVAEKKPAPAAEKKPAPAAERSGAAPVGVAEKKPAPAAEKKSQPPPVDTIEGLQVGSPMFSEKDGEWRMVITATGPVEIKHFTLKNPPRLAVDFKGAVYSGKKRTQESPAPSVARIRVGEQPEFTRFVLDFEGPTVPQHRIVKKEDRVVVIFGR